MAKASRTKHLSLKPSEAERGGNFGFPVGAVCTVTEIKAGTWEEAGEKALVGGRSAEDPALIITCEIEGADDPVTEFLGAGKANRSVPSDDGEFFDPAEGSSAQAMSASSNAHFFLASLFDKKRQGKNVLDEDILDDGFSALLGLKFVAGREKPEGRDIEGSKNKPVLVADEILEEPTGPGKSAKSKTSSKSKRVEREEPEEEEEKFARRSSSKKRGGDDEDEEAAQTAVLELLENPKYKKGLPVGKAFNAVFNVVKTLDNKKAIIELVEDEDWLTSDDRPWQVEGKGDDQVILPA